MKCRGQKLGNKYTREEICNVIKTQTGIREQISTGKYVNEYKYQYQHQNSTTTSTQLQPRKTNSKRSNTREELS